MDPDVTATSAILITIPLAFSMGCVMGHHHLTRKITVHHIFLKMSCNGVYYVYLLIYTVYTAHTFSNYTLITPTSTLFHS